LVHGTFAFFTSDFVAQLLLFIFRFFLNSYLYFSGKHHKPPQISPFFSPFHLLPSISKLKIGFALSCKLEISFSSSPKALFNLLIFAFISARSCECEFFGLRAWTSDSSKYAPFHPSYIHPFIEEF